MIFGPRPSDQAYLRFSWPIVIHLHDTALPLP